VAHSILLVDDDPHIRDVVRFAFEKTGMAISIAQDGKEALARFDRNVHDLIVLDIGMPEMDGLEVCRQIRKTSDTPILFLSARDEEIDRILGLEIGGDDYVTKPFSPRELVARVRALLRRADRAAAVPGEAVRVGSLTIDLATRLVKRGSQEVQLTPTEFDLLYRIAQTPHVVFGRRRLLEEVWGYRVGAGERTVDSHVRALRRKLGSDVIRTVHGIGYALDTNGLL
jgi:two-component system OmpR family response regulator